MIDLMIPFWGSPAYLQETVTSIRNQNNPNWRLTVIDDAYPGTEVQEYLAGLHDDRIRYIRKPTNEGIIENFRSCVTEASAPLMAMPGCDDRLLPNYVDEVLRVAEMFPKASIIETGVALIDSHGSASNTVADRVKQNVLRPRGHGRQILSGERLATSLLHGDWLYWPSLAFRTERIQATPFREGFPVILDLALILDLIFNGETLALSPVTAFEYRRHVKSLSSEKLFDGTRFTDERRYFQIAAGQARARGWRDAHRAARTRITSRAYAALTAVDAVRARDHGALRSLARHTLGR